MLFAEGRQGRIFVVRLEDGDRLPDTIEEFAGYNDIARAICIIVGGAGPGRLVVGPKDGKAMPPEPMIHVFNDVYEIAGVGTIFPNESGKPVLHMHSAFGRDGKTITGCVRKGVEIWKVGEVIIMEITGVSSIRKKDPETGFELLEPGHSN